MDLLQNQLRPKTLKNVYGQKHLIGKDKILTNLVKNKKMFNIILYGRSGTGKTTIALALVNDLQKRYKVLNATINSKKDFETVFEEAKMNNGLILIIDEIHRMNKDKQDLLLSYIESGLITLIGITSTNPYHTVNSAIRSRCQMLELNSLETSDIKKAIKNISIVLKNINLKKETIDYIASLSCGDLRYAYNLIEFCYYSFGNTFSIDQIKEINSKPNFFHDKNEDAYYDLISAFQKSIRGSDQDAAIYYLARLLEGGDLESVCRRLNVVSYEDIGLANPLMGPKVDAAINSAIRLGLPEARIPLASIVIELAMSPKSNSAKVAIDSALNDIRSKDTGHVPEHLKTTSPNYKYPHLYKNYYIKQQYLPDKIKDKKYYIPKNNKYEKELFQFNTKIKKND